MKNKILVLDIETTGFLTRGGSIVEIGIVELNLDNGEINIIYDSLCRETILNASHREYLDYKLKGLEPPKTAKGWIFGNSDLDPEDVRKAPLFERVKVEVQDIINKYPNGVTAFNKRFDLDFLKDRGIIINKELPCPMLLSTPICKLPNMNGFSDYKWPKVEEAYKFFFPGSEYIEEHRGADDAKHEAQIVYELYKRGIFKID